MKRKTAWVRWYRRALVLLVALAVCFVVATAEPATPDAAQPQSPSALFLNVGKADAALYFLSGQVYLIDTGTKDSAPALLKGLETYGIKKLHGVFITHTDKDHVGGLKTLLESGMAVDQLYAPRFHSEKSDEKHPVYKAAQEFDLPMTWLQAGDGVVVDEGTSFTVLGPLTKDPENENNNSLVLDLQTPEGNMLLVGDMEFAEEEALLRAGAIPKATVLKVGHHGEDDASGVAFLSTVKPQWAVISTSTEEEKDTPDPKVMGLLWQVKANVAVTQEATCGILVTLAAGTATAQKIDYKP